MQKILMILTVCSLILLSSCSQKGKVNIETGEEARSFDSPGLLHIDENTSLTETGLGDE